MNFLPHQFRASGLINEHDYAKDSNMSLSSQPSARCHLNVSLVIALPKKTEFTSLQIEQFLRGSRLAGGNVIKYGKIYCEASTHQEALSAIGKNGWCIVERPGVTMTMQTGDRDIIDVLLRQIRPSSESKQQSKEFTDLQLGLSPLFVWAMPVFLLSSHVTNHVTDYPIYMSSH